MGFKITYSVSPENMVEIDKNYDQAIEDVKKRIGQEYPALLGNQPIDGEGTTDNFNPANIIHSDSFVFSISCDGIDVHFVNNLFDHCFLII